MPLRCPKVAEWGGRWFCCCWPLLLSLCLHSQKISSPLHSDYGKSGGCYRCPYELPKNRTTTRRALTLQASVLHLNCALGFPGTLQQRSSSKVLTQFSEVFQKTTFSYLIVIFVSNFIEGKLNRAYLVTLFYR